jgi:DtxR family transcriptional regulator, Mn-dependent transcriptional regulator
MNQTLCILSASFDPALALLAALLCLAAFTLWQSSNPAQFLRTSRALRARVRAEDALKQVYQAQMEDRVSNLQSLAGAMGITLNAAAQTIADLQKAGWLSLEGAELRLTPQGERYALNVIRAHRLWEQHLAEKTGVAELEWHRQAELQEHFITPQQADTLAAGLGNPTHDPHGDPIPDALGDFVARSGVPLSSLPSGRWARVVHIEDEPEQVYAQICAVGLSPGMMLRLVESNPQRLRFWCDGEEHVLAPIVAANISAVPLAQPTPDDEPAGALLSHLVCGQRARVVRISRRCRGAERRRLMDLGILPGTVLTSELRSPAGQLTAYRVRDTLIALRQEQAALIQVAPANATPQ